MPKLSANLTWLFTEQPFLERIGSAAACGFKGVEFQSPFEFPAADVAAAMKKADVQNVLFNCQAGADRGYASTPGREKEFDASIDLALEYAAVLGTPRAHVMAGNVVAGATPEEMEKTYRANLARAAKRCAAAGLELVIEPLNRRDNPTYYLGTTQHAIETIDAVGSPNLKLQFDLYHCQVQEGDLDGHIHKLKGRFTHVQLAGNPGRNEPSHGEVNYPFVLGVLDASGYDGWVGCEYKPLTTTRESLAWARPYGITP